MAKIPTVVIGGIPYEIRFVDDLMEDHGALGFIQFEKQLISIDPTLPEQRKAQTIIHEAMHAIFYEAGFSEHDEDLVNTLAIALFRMIVETDPSFYRYIRNMAGSNNA